MSEVTPEMLAAAHKACQETLDGTEDDALTAIYRAMRLARPLSEGPGV